MSSALKGSPPGLAAWIDQRPRAAFAAFLALHGIIWTALPALLYPNLALDLLEGVTYGREWPLGSDKLPPLPWWLVEIMRTLFGVDAAYYALAQALVIAAFVLVWMTARPLVGATRALVAVLIIDGLHYFHYSAVKFNHNVAELPFWALAGYAFHAALKRKRLSSWLLLGIALGGAFWAKYFVVVLAAPLALFLFFDREARPALATPGPWIALAVAFLIASPHLVWLVDNNFAPLAYAESHAAPARGWFDHIVNPAVFLLGQVGFLVPALFIAAGYAWPGRPEREPSPLAGEGWEGGRVATRHRSTLAQILPTPAPNPSPQRGGELFAFAGTADAFDRRIVTLLAFGPAVFMVLLTAASGRGTIAMWGYPLWLFVGLWIVLNVPRAEDAARLTRTVAAWSLVFAVFVIAFVLNYTLLPRLDHRYRSVFFPGDRLAAELTQRFHAATGAPLAYVIGSMWDGGNVAYYSPDRPQVLIDGAPRRAPWIDLNDLRTKGGVVVWTETGDPSHLPAAFAAIAGSAEVGAPFTLPMRRGDGEVHVGWAILKPR